MKLSNEKPRLRRIRPVFYGVVCAPYWACRSADAFGYAETPDAAYKAWQSDVPKGTFGRLMRRVVNWGQAR